MSLSAVVGARVLGPSGRGILALELTLASLTGLITTLGITISCRVLLVADRQPVTLADYIGLSLTLTLVQGVISLVVVRIGLPLVGVRLSPMETMVFGLCGMSLVSAAAALNALYAYGRFGAAGFMEAAGGLITLGLTAVAAIAGTRWVPVYVGAISIGLLVSLVGSVIHLRAVGQRLVPRYRLAAWKLLVRQGIPGIGLTLSQSAAYRFDRYLVGLYLTPAAVGFYSVAATATELLRILPTSIGNVLVHRLAALRYGHDKSYMVYRVALTASAVPVIILLVVGNWLLVTIFGVAYVASVDAFRILLFGEIAVASFLIDSSQLMGRGDVGRASLSAAVGLIIVTSLDLILIESHGIEGAAWASIAGYAFMAVLARYFVVRGHYRGPRENQSPGMAISTHP